MKAYVTKSTNQWNSRKKSYGKSIVFGVRKIRNIKVLKDSYDGRLVTIGEANIKGETVRVGVSDNIKNIDKNNDVVYYGSIIPKGAWDSVYSNFEEVAA